MNLSEHMAKPINVINIDLAIYNEAMANVMNDGDTSTTIANGNMAMVSTGGNNSKVIANGVQSQINAFEIGSQAVATGENSLSAVYMPASVAVTTNSDSKAVSYCTNAIAASLGKDSVAQGAKGSWLVLADWQYNIVTNQWYIKQVRGVEVDGVYIKEDTPYFLESGLVIEYFEVMEVLPHSLDKEYSLVFDDAKRLCDYKSYNVGKAK